MKKKESERKKLNCAIEELRRKHAFIASSAAWSEHEQYRKGFLDALETAIAVLKSYYDDAPR